MTYNDELERQKIEALAEFAAGAGHEINNPLAAINGHTQLLLREIENPEHRRHLGIISAQVKRIYEMIADVRYFACPPKPEPERFDLVGQLKKLLEEQTPLMTEAGITLNFCNEIEETLEMETDPVQLHLVLIFLCNNARESLRQTGGHVTLRLKTDGEFVEIAVEDDGVGVSDEIRPLIFCPYYSGRQAGRGLGFGLPKSWRIMQQLGGSIGYETPESGCGARFVVRLPISQMGTSETI